MCVLVWDLLAATVAGGCREKVGVDDASSLLTECSSCITSALAIPVAKLVDICPPP